MASCSQRSDHDHKRRHGGRRPGRVHPPQLNLFDVDATLSDMSPMAARFTDVGRPAGVPATGFADLLRDGFTLAVTGANRRCRCRRQLVAVHPWDIHGAHGAGLRTAGSNRSGARYPATLHRAELEADSLTRLERVLIGG